MRFSFINSIIRQPLPYEMEIFFTCHILARSNVTLLFLLIERFLLDIEGEETQTGEKCCPQLVLLFLPQTPGDDNWGTGIIIIIGEPLTDYCSKSI